MRDVDRYARLMRGPRLQPNRRLSAPYQYGHPMGWRDAVGFLLLILIVGALSVAVVQWVPR